MACHTKVYIYSDLDGRTTGEFDLACTEKCPDGKRCEKRVRGRATKGARSG